MVEAVDPDNAPFGDSGFGMADIVNELMSRDPKSLPVSSVAQMQQSLVDMGYAETEPDGAWSPYWHSAFRRSERDSMDLVRSGKHWGSAPLQTFFRYLGYTVPSEVFKAVWGTAEGIIKEAANVLQNPVETAEEAGLAGGATAGAIVGATVGGLPGALVGGAIGGGIGFFADLFGDDEDEDPDGFWQSVWDAMSPYDEYKESGAKNFFALLNTVMTASGIAKATGVAMGAKNVLKGKDLAAALTVRGKGEVAPGLVAQMTKWAVERPVVGGATLGAGGMALPHLLVGDFEGAASAGIKGAVGGAVLGPVAHRVMPEKAKQAVLRGLEAAPLRRLETAPLFQAAQKVYTGAATAGMSGRIFGGMGPGESEIEDAIEGAPNPGSLGTVMDWTVGSLLYPERLLPWRARDISRSIQSTASNHLLIPFAETSRRYVDEAGQVKFRSFRQAIDHAKETLGQGPHGFDPALMQVRVGYAYLQKGVHDRAEQALKGAVFDSQWDRAAALSEERSKIWGQMFEEGGAELGKAVPAETLVRKSSLAKSIYGEARANPHGMTWYLDSFEGKGSSIENFLEHQRASETLQGLTREWSELTVTRQKPGKRGRAVLEVEEPKLDEGLILTPAVRDNAAEGVTGYQTKDDFRRAQTTYRSAAEAYDQAYKAAGEAVLSGGPLPDTLRSAGRSLDEVLFDLRRRGMISDGELGRLRASGPDNGVLKRLERIGKMRPAEDVEATTLLEKAMGFEPGKGRYIALRTGEKMLFYDQVPKLLEVAGINAYSRREGFYDLIAGMTTKVDDMYDLGKRRYYSVAAELDVAMHELGIKMSGRQAADRIQDELRSRYDPMSALGRGEQLSGWGVVITRRHIGTGKVERELFKLDPRDLTPEDIAGALRLDGPEALEQAARVKEALHTGASFGADAMKFPMHPVQQARALARGMKLTGLQGFNDFMRTVHVPFLERKFPENSFAWLPQNAHRVSMALRYSLSPTFDAGRYLEQATLGIYKGQIPPAAAFAPRRFLEKKKGGWKFSPYQSDAVAGEDAVQHALRFYDEEILGRSVMTDFDDLQMRLLQRGILGFSPRQAEAAQAWVMYQQKASRAAAQGRTVGAKEIEEIREAVMEIGRYGTGQSAIAKSVHFIIFPAMFQAKLIRHMHDFVLGAPVRNLIVHEGLRRWYQVNAQGETMSGRFKDFMEKHLPLASELGRLNNLSYGLGAGRFFLEGIGDRSSVGKVTQALSAFFVPGGAHQPLHEFIGSASEQARSLVPDEYKHFFVPVVLTEDAGKEGIMALSERLIPLHRDLSQFFNDSPEDPGVIQQQITAIGEGASPYWQMQEYLDGKKQLESILVPVAEALGYSSVSGLMSSDAGAPFRKLSDQFGDELAAELPTGARMAASFTDRDQLKDQKLYALEQKNWRSEGEDAITLIGELEEQVKESARQAGVAQETLLAAVAPALRKYAMAYQNDKQFVALWDRLFAYTYGPLRRIA